MDIDKAQISKAQISGPTGFTKVKGTPEQIAMAKKIAEEQAARKQENGVQERAAVPILQVPDNPPEVASKEVYKNSTDVEISSLKKQLAEDKARGLYDEARHQELADKMFARFQSIMDDNDHKRLGGYERNIEKNT